MRGPGPVPASSFNTATWAILRAGLRRTALRAGLSLLRRLLRAGAAVGGVALREAVLREAVFALLDVALRALVLVVLVFAAVVLRPDTARERLVPLLPAALVVLVPERDFRVVAFFAAFFATWSNLPDRPGSPQVIDLHLFTDVRASSSRRPVIVR